MTQISNKKTHILDVRTPGEFSTGHVSGAINIPLNELMQHLDFLKELEGELILCCASGIRSASAVNVLQQHGFKNVVNGGSWVSLT